MLVCAKLILVLQVGAEWSFWDLSRIRKHARLCRKKNMCLERVVKDHDGGLWFTCKEEK